MAEQTSTIQLPFTTSHAFIIGIDDYQHVSPLSTAVNDAEVIAQCLEEQHGFRVHPPLINATHGEIKQLLEEQIPQMVKEDDRIVFYFAGHGIAQSSDDGPNGYILAADTQPGQEDSLVPMQLIHDALTGLPCRHGLLILDCCFAGTIKWSSGFRDAEFDIPKVIYKERFWRYCKDPAWQVITSAAHDQKAMDSISNQSLGFREEGRGNHSPFASSLLQALEGAGDVVPQGAGDGVMTAAELYAYLRDSVETQTTTHAMRQSPSIFHLQRHDKGEFIFLSPRHRFNLPPTPDRNPFMGLSCYQEEDATLFYGRERVVEALLEKVKQQSLLVVSGASGTGKSSVIKAGLLPVLRKQGYTILPVIRPGRNPMQRLAEILSPAEGGAGEENEDATVLPLDPPPKGDNDLRKEEKNGLGEGPTVMVIDQYEELITQCLHEEERHTFEQQLASWLQKYPGLRIILSIRSDFEPQFKSEALAKWWQPGRYIVPAFSLQEIQEVIAKPADQAVLFFEPANLIHQLSEEVSQSPGALPLLSFTLSELYYAYLKSGREDRALSVEDYHQLGGVTGALRTRADAEYQSLQQEEQNSMRKLMLRMVSLKGGEVAGKRVYAKELVFQEEAETKRLQTIANQLVDARLLLKGIDQQGQAYVEPAHDALVRAWARLWEWIKIVGEERIILQNELHQAAKKYHDFLERQPKTRIAIFFRRLRKILKMKLVYGKSTKFLWGRNPGLDTLKAELAGATHNLNAQEAEFVETSLQKRRNQNVTLWYFIFITLGYIILFSWKFASERSLKSSLANSLAQQSALLRDTDPTIAYQLAEASMNTSRLRPYEGLLPEGDLLSAFYHTIIEGEAGIFYQSVPQMPYEQGTEQRLQESPPEGIKIPPTQDGKFRRANSSQSFNSRQQNFYLTTKVGPDGTYSLELADLRAQTWSVRTYLDQDVLFGPLSFDPEEKRIIIPNKNKLQFFAPSDITQPLYELAAPAAVEQAYFSSDGQQVYAKTFDGRYFRWNLQAFTIPEITTTPFLSGDLYWAPDGQTAVLTDSVIQVWVVDNGKWQSRSGQGPPTLSADPPIITQTGYADIMLENYTSFSLGELNRESSSEIISGSYRYQVTYPDDRRSVTIIETWKDHEDWGGDTVTLFGHTEAINSIDINDPYTLTASDKELKLWDWQGNNIFSMAKGGQAGFIPPYGNSIFLYSFAPGDDQTQGLGTSHIQILPISVDQIRDWVQEQDIYQLSPAEKDRYGIPY